MMTKKKKIFAINGSASDNSSNLLLLQYIAALTTTKFEFTILDDLSELPPFRTALTTDNTPKRIVQLRKDILDADGILICTPEYVFSIPSGLKNLLEWCVSTTVFSGKPVGLITAAASGEKAHEELQLIMKTIETVFTEKTALLIQGIKGKIGVDGDIIDGKTKADLAGFVEAFWELV